MPLRAAWHFTHRGITMEGLPALHRPSSGDSAGVDVHRMLHVVTVLIEQPDGSMDKHSRAFSGFKRDCRALRAAVAPV
jgi:hypothetical protein